MCACSLTVSHNSAKAGGKLSQTELRRVTARCSPSLSSGSPHSAPSFSSSASHHGLCARLLRFSTWPPPLRSSHLHDKSADLASSAHCFTRFLCLLFWLVQRLFAESSTP